MKRKINNKVICSFNPCYDPTSIGIPNNELLTVREWIIKYRNKVKSPADIVWLLCRPEFITERNCRLFAVWCAREALKLIENPDQRSIDACNVAEKFVNNNATKEELDAARDAASDAARAAARDAASDAASDAARAAAWAAASDAARAAAWAAAWAAVWAAVWAAASDAARAAASDAARAAAWAAQIDKLLTYFEK